jgi:hypothetical protein
MTTNLTDLAVRVEAATGPDRELDGSIWWATRSSEEIAHIDPTGFVRQCIERDGSAGKALAGFYDSSNRGCLANIAFSRQFTASLDAAMMLVPEGWEFIRLERDRALPGADRQWDFWAVLMQPHGSGYSKTDAATPALALTAACLRALSR